MVCRNDSNDALIWWDNTTLYAVLAEPTDNQRKLADAVNNLPDVCKKVVILFAFECIARDRIAEKMAISLTSLRFLIHRSGLLIHEYLIEQEKQHWQSKRLNREFSGWPCIEYASLVELRKDLVLFG
jgi:DNA-directed RNA polymerase specialized sigma24 family protein